MFNAIVVVILANIGGNINLKLGDLAIRLRIFV